MKQPQKKVKVNKDEISEFIELKGIKLNTAFGTIDKSKPIELNLIKNWKIDNLVENFDTNRKQQIDKIIKKVDEYAKGNQDILEYKKILEDSK